MSLDGSMLKALSRVALVDADSEDRQPDVRTRATRDLALVQRWAALRDATPATGEASPSGPRTVDLRDGGSGLRFNFPALSPFRPISWAEWFEHFESHGLTFVFESEEPGRPLSGRWQVIRTTELARFVTLV